MNKTLRKILISFLIAIVFLILLFVLGKVKEDYRHSKIQRLEREAKLGSEEAKYKLLKVLGNTEELRRLKKEAKLKKKREKERAEEEAKLIKEEAKLIKEYSKKADELEKQLSKYAFSLKDKEKSSDAQLSFAIDKFLGMTPLELAQREVQLLERLLLDAQIETEWSIEDCLNEGKRLQQAGNIEEASYYYKKASEKGSTDADRLLVGIYSKKENYQEVVKWLAKLSEKGEVEAEITLGKIYYYGLNRYYSYSYKEHIDQNHKEAARWFSKASEKGAIIADLAMGKMHYKRGDYREAIKWYLKAIKKGSDIPPSPEGFTEVVYSISVIAELALGKIYYTGGNGIVSDYEESFKWYSRAAVKDDYFAKFRLGQMYLEGKAVPQDGELAVKLLTESAKDGYGEAAVLLCKTYHHNKKRYPEGAGVVEADKVSSYMWHIVSEMLGGKYAPNIEEDLTSEQIKQAQQKASEFTKDIKHIERDIVRAKWGLEEK